jgi:outer membrane protein assembly factor BamA
MRRFLLTLALCYCAAILSNSGLGQPPAKKTKKTTEKVGNIIIIGDEITQDTVIRRAVGLYPGQKLRYSDLRKAQRRLARLGFFNVDSNKGIRPSLTVLESDDEYKDILVAVQEAPTTKMLISFGIGRDAGLGGSLVLEEPNFDPLRFPTHMADIYEGRAFRGAGQKFRLELLRVSLAPRGVSFIRLGGGCKHFIEMILAAASL